jgi:hypothetical protein
MKKNPRNRTSTRPHVKGVGITKETVLYDGPARHSSPFSQNVNSLHAGSGVFGSDRTCSIRG